MYITITYIIKEQQLIMDKTQLHRKSHNIHISLIQQDNDTLHLKHSKNYAIGAPRLNVLLKASIDRGTKVPLYRSVLNVGTR